MDGLAWLIVGVALALAGPSMTQDMPASLTPDGHSKLAEPSSLRIEGTEISSPMQSEVVIIDGAFDVNEFWRRFDQPGLLTFTLKSQGLKPAIGSIQRAVDAKESPPFATTSIRVAGRVVQEMADLDLEIELELLKQGPNWIPIGLDGQVVIGASEKGREVLLQNKDGSHWEIRLEGRGAHKVRVGVKVPVSAANDRKGFGLAIPLATSTSVELDISRPVFEAELGEGEIPGLSPIPGGIGTRITAHVTPRARISVSWSDVADAMARTAPLITAGAEIAIDLDSRSMTTRSTWAIRCVRGVVNSLTFRLDDSDAVSRVQLENRDLLPPVQDHVLIVPLAEPLRPGGSRRLILETRRNLPEKSTGVITFSGLPLSQASEQSGFIGVTQGENLFVNVVRAQGVRRIETRHLPSSSDLRARPGICLTFQFLQQPFQLGFMVEDSPPLFRAGTRANIELKETTIRSRASIEIQRERGRIFELVFGLTPEMELVSVGPPEVVDSTTLAEHTPSSSAAGPLATSRFLKVRLSQQGKEQRTSILELEGRQRVPREGEMRLGLFSIFGAVATSGEYEVLADRSVICQLTENEDSISGLARLNGQPWGDGNRWDAADRIPVLRLQNDGNPQYLGVRITRRALSIKNETNLAAQVTPHWIEVRQESTLDVRYGVLPELTIAVPESVADRWQVLGKDKVKREEIVSAEKGCKRYRLTPEKPFQDRTSLLFQFRLPISLKPGATEATTCSIRRIVIEQGDPGPTILRLGCDPDVWVEPQDQDWSLASDESEVDRPTSSVVREFRWEPGGRRDPGTFSLNARRLDRAIVPSIVVTRALFRTALGVEPEAQTRAWLRLEQWQGDLNFALPAGARWIRAKLDGRLMEQVEFDPARNSYRLTLPAEMQSRPVVLELEYLTPRHAMSDAWDPLRILNSGVVMETLWQLQVPWNTVLVGVPYGWSDENQWYWDSYLWKRRPRVSSGTLMGWVVGAPTSNQGVVIDELAGGYPNDSHPFLFGRAGAPVELHVSVWDRTSLFACCSGLALMIGMLLIFAGRYSRMTSAFLAVLGLISVNYVHPSSIWILLQSAMSGIILVLLGFMIRKSIDHGRGTSRVVASGASNVTAQVLSSSSSELVGSDDSTAIRVRSPSTVDRATLPSDERASSLIDGGGTGGGGR